MAVDKSWQQFEKTGKICYYLMHKGVYRADEIDSDQTPGL